MCFLEAELTTTIDTTTATTNSMMTKIMHGMERLIRILDDNKFISLYRSSAGSQEAWAWNENSINIEKRMHTPLHPRLFHYRYESVLTKKRNKEKKERERRRQ